MKAATSNCAVVSGIVYSSYVHLMALDIRIQ
jgi:hypothetical protein